MNFAFNFQLEKITTKWKNSIRPRSNFSIRHSCTQVARSHISSNLLGFVQAWDLHSMHARVRESFFASNLIHYKMCNYIYTLTSQYKFLIWNNPFSTLILQLSGSTLSNNFSFIYSSFWTYKYTKLIFWRRTIINFDSTKIVNWSYLF